MATVSTHRLVKSVKRREVWTLTFGRGIDAVWLVAARKDHGRTVFGLDIPDYVREYADCLPGSMKCREEVDWTLVTTHEGALRPRAKSPARRKIRDRIEHYASKDVGDWLLLTSEEIGESGEHLTEWLPLDTPEEEIERMEKLLDEEAFDAAVECGWYNEEED